MVFALCINVSQAQKQGAALRLGLKCNYTEEDMMTTVDNSPRFNRVL